MPTINQRLNQWMRQNRNTQAKMPEIHLTQTKYQPIGLFPHKFCVEVRSIDNIYSDYTETALVESCT